MRESALVALLGKQWNPGLYILHLAWELAEVGAEFLL